MALKCDFFSAVTWFAHIFSNWIVSWSYPTATWQPAFYSLSGTKLSPILNINTNNKLLFPWALCDSSKLLLFTSCTLFSGGAYWKATAHSAQQHNTLEPVTAATQASRRKDLFVRENKWSNCAKWLPVPWCEEIMTRVADRKRTIERKNLIVWVMSVVCNEYCLPLSLCLSSSIHDHEHRAVVSLCFS